jgi:hypothetical protein
MRTTRRLAAILAADVVGYTSGPNASLMPSLRHAAGPCCREAANSSARMHFA